MFQITLILFQKALRLEPGQKKMLLLIRMYKKTAF